MKKLIALLLALALLTAAVPLIAARSDVYFDYYFGDQTHYIGENDDVVTVELYYDTVLNLLDGMLEITYDPDVMELQIPKKISKLVPLDSSATVEVNADVPGVIRIAFMSTAGLDMTGSFAGLPFKLLDPRADTTLTVSSRFIRLMYKSEDSAVGINLVTEGNNFPIEGFVTVKEPLPVNTTLLQQAMELPVGDALSGDPANAAAYSDALAAAQRILEDPGATQQQVNAALEDLTAAQMACFTSETAAAYTEALAEAQRVLEDPEATREDKEEALNALNTAAAQLTQLPDDPDDPETPEVPAEPDPPAPLKGDADGNDKVDSTDARLTLQIAVNKLTKADVKNPDAIDVDGNGTVDSTDARLILQYAVNKITEWP